MKNNKPDKCPQCTSIFIEKAIGWDKGYWRCLVNKCMNVWKVKETQNEKVF